MTGRGHVAQEPWRLPVHASGTRPDDRAGPRGPGALPGGTSTIVVRPANTFDWGDAAIGAVSGMGFALLLVGLAVLTIVTRTKSRVVTR